MPQPHTLPLPPPVKRAEEYYASKCNEPIIRYEFYNKRSAQYRAGVIPRPQYIFNVCEKYRDAMTQEIENYFDTFRKFRKHGS